MGDTPRGSPTPFGPELSFEQFPDSDMHFSHHPEMTPVATSNPWRSGTAVESQEIPGQTFVNEHNSQYNNPLFCTEEWRYKDWPNLALEKPRPFPEDFDTVDMHERIIAEAAIYGHNIPGHPELVRTGTRYRPMRDGGGPTSVGRYRSENMWKTPLHRIGAIWTRIANTLGLGKTLQAAI